MQDMVYQGTVFGAPLWNIFAADARDAIATSGFSEIVFADDLNAYRVPERSCSDADAYLQIRACQDRLHRWGEANQ
eukprot:13014397-Alexandrium_andersonii.AAC.1